MQTATTQPVEPTDTEWDTYTMACSKCFVLQNLELSNSGKCGCCGGELADR